MSRFNVSFLSLVCFFFSLFPLMIACSRVPKGILPEKKMKQVLIDIHLADAIINSDSYTFQHEENKIALYQSVFEKHRVTEAVYDSSLIWYGKNLDIYMQVYNMALADVKKRIEKIGPIEYETDQTANADSIDIWSDSRNFEFFPASLSNTLNFNFKEAEEYASGSIFVLKLHVLGFVPAMQSPVEVHIHAIQNDTTIVVRHQIVNDGYHEMILRTLPVRRVNRVYGYIRFNESNVFYHKVLLNDLQMIKYRYGTEAANRLDGKEIN